MALFAKNMRFFSLFRAALLVLFIISFLNPAMAGEYHASEVKTTSGITTIACSQCHTMHGTQGGVSMIYAGGGSGVQEKLLRFNSILGLCLYCHDGDNASLNAPDVKAVPAGSQNYIPSAGRFSDRSSDNYANMHDVGLAAPTPPGYTGTWTDVTNKFGTTFNCIYCHDNHGNENYRNLRYDPGNPANDSSTSANRVRVTYTADITTPFADPNINTVDVNYWGDNASVITDNRFSRNNVRFRRAPLDGDNPKQGIAAWCGKCHVQFYGISVDANMGGVTGGNPGAGDNNTGATSPWIRHPVQDISLGLATTNMHADSSATSLWASLGATVRTRHINSDAAVLTDDQPFCLSCHYAHGGGNPNATAAPFDPLLDHSNLVYMDTSGNNVNIDVDANYAASEGMMRNTCQQCHNQ